MKTIKKLTKKEIKEIKADIKKIINKELKAVEASILQQCDKKLASIGEATNLRDDDLIEFLNFGTRTKNLLIKLGITTVGELAARTPSQLLFRRDLGRSTFQEIRNRLATCGRSLS